MFLTEKVNEETIGQNFLKMGTTFAIGTTWISCSCNRYVLFCDDTGHIFSTTLIQNWTRDRLPTEVCDTIGLTLQLHVHVHELESLVFVFPSLQPNSSISMYMNCDHLDTLLVWYTALSMTGLAVQPYVIQVTGLHNEHLIVIFLVMSIRLSFSMPVMVFCNRTMQKNIFS